MRLAVTRQELELAGKNVPPLRRVNGFDAGTADELADSRARLLSPPGFAE
jgi:hypothetical protein